MVELFINKKENIVRQRTFRVMLDAFSHPGRIFHIQDIEHYHEHFNYLVMVLDLLLDHETSHCIIDEDFSRSLDHRIYEITKSPSVPLEAADYIIAPCGSTKGGLCRVKKGEPQYPDLSATIVYGVDAILTEMESISKYILRGSGIDNTITLPVITGFDHREILELREVNRSFPLGIEAVFIDRTGSLMAITRSTQIYIKDTEWPILQ